MLPTYHQIASSQTTDAELDELLTLVAQLFPDIDQADCRWRLARMPEGRIFCARINDGLVGFKAGYAIKLRYHYSWLGGVHPQWLRRGIARGLMQQQHDWLQSQGYRSVETRAQAANKAMCALNEASGFTAVGLQDKARGQQITFVKSLQG